MAWQEARGAFTRPLVSVAMIVGDETDELVRCLNSLAGLFDELCIVITGTNPQTVEIAKSFGAKILMSPWRADFAFHRNQALDMATGIWILVVDADETAIDTNFEETRHYLEHHKLPDRPVHIPLPSVFEATGYASGFVEHYKHPIEGQPFRDYEFSRAVVGKPALALLYCAWWRIGGLVF